jgi:hypothetical protein
MQNVESAKLTGRWSIVAAFIADLIQKTLADIAQKSVRLPQFSFGDQFDPAVWQVSYEAYHLVPACDQVRCVTKSNTLHMP